jgi:eukaryotic-like serine/threonine-protein kinase
MVRNISNPQIGEIIAHYKIIEKLGEGGMGVVFKAEDTKLQRIVALKFLPQEFTRDLEAKERFVREAQAASSLEHTNICNVHEIGETADGQIFIVMAYYEGESLHEKIKLAPIEAEMAIEIAIQIAQGLAKAHEQGIVHRDIKSANVHITKDNVVKILDFGLAKLGNNSKLTKEHTMMGTLTYVSPEQLHGTEVDNRAEIWSFGVVLYEMLTGELPFKNEHDAAVMYAIINEDPEPASAVRSSIPIGLVRIINKALQKEKQDRYQNMDELLDDLLKMDAEALKRTSRIGLPIFPGKVKRKLKKIIPVAAVFLAIAATAVFFRFIEQKSMNDTWQSKPIVSMAGVTIHPAFSPDGKMIAFSWNGGSGNDYNIYIQTVGRQDYKPLTSHPGSDTHPIWTADGRSIFFRRIYNGEISLHFFSFISDKEDSIYSFRPVEKGPNPFVFATRLRKNNLTIHPSSPLPPNSFALMPDDETIIGRTRETSSLPYHLVAYNWKTHQIDTLTTPEHNSYGDFLFALSPDGTRLAFARCTIGERGNIFTQLIDDNEAKQLTSEALNINSLTWTSDGQDIIFSHSGTNLQYTSSQGLWRIPATGGTPQPVIPGTQHAQNPAISLNGNLLAYCLGPARASALYKLSLKNLTEKLGVKKIDLLAKSENSVDISPNGKKIAIRSDRYWTEEILTSDLDGNDLQQVTPENDTLRGKGSPRWCPNSKYIAFDALPINKSNRDIYILNPEDRTYRQLTFDLEYDAIPQWSQDGVWVYFRSKRSGREEIWKIPVEEGGEAIQVTFNGGFHPMESPDGAWLYFSKRDNNGIWRIPVSGGEEEVVIEEDDQLKDEKMHKKHWTVVERGIYFIRIFESDSKFTVEFFDFASHEMTPIHEEEGEPGLHIDVTLDGGTLLFSKVEGVTSEIMLAENFR